MTFAAILLSLIFTAAPRGSSYAPETGEEQDARYVSIVADALAVGQERPLPGLSGRQTTVVLLAVAHRESAFARDADLGPCSKTFTGRCDYGRAVCLLQIQARTREERAEIATDRRACFRRGLELLRGGRGCSEPYAAFAGGTCSPSAVRGGREIRGYVRRWLARVEGGPSS